MSGDHTVAKAESAAKLSRANAKLDRCRDRGNVRLSDLEAVRNDLAELVDEHSAALDELERLRAENVGDAHAVAKVIRATNRHATGRDSLTQLHQAIDALEQRFDDRFDLLEDAAAPQQPAQPCPSTAVSDTKAGES